MQVVTMQVVTMQWGSVSGFFEMGGYGLYVWGSYVVTAVAMAAEVFLVRRRGRTPAAQASPTAGEHTNQ